jgi:O-antigen/teichoic acid export membrane protein
MGKIISLNGQAVNGVKWTGLSTLITSVFQYVQVAVLTKFLTSSDFGIMAMALVVIGLAQAYTDLGISNAIIQRQNTTKDNLSSLYWLEIMAGVSLFLLMFLATPLTVQFFGEPSLKNVMLGTSIVFLVTPLGQQFQILMQRELEFRRLAMIDIVSSVASTAITILAAFFGYGVMALVISQLSFYGLRSFQFLWFGLARWKPALHFKTADLHGYLDFGLYQMGERTVTYFSINVINLIIGKFLGPIPLGHYSLAYQLIINPILRFNTVFMTVAFPIFSKFQDKNSLLIEGYLLMTRFIAFTIFPVLVLIFSIAPVFVPVILGDAWLDVIPLIQILCIVGLFKSLGTATVPTYLAKGHADLGFIWNFFVSAVNGALFYFTTRYGIIALTWSFAALSLIQFLMIQTITGNMIGLKWRTYLLSIVRQSLLCLVLGFMLYGTYLLGRSAHISRLVIFILLILVFAISWAFLTLRFNRDYLMELKALIMPA